MTCVILDENVCTLDTIKNLAENVVMFHYDMPKPHRNSILGDDASSNPYNETNFPASFVAIALIISTISSICSTPIATPPVRNR